MLLGMWSSFMNKHGNPELSELSERPLQRRIPLWLWVTPFIFIVALLISFQSISILLALLMPPMPPLAPNLTLLEHHTSAYGQDEWRYEGDLCASVAFYAEGDFACRWYNTCPEDGRMMPNIPLGSCQATQNFALFGMRWQVQIDSAGTPERAVAHLKLVREISWSASFPDPSSSEVP
jgi:hypothetical protein